MGEFGRLSGQRVLGHYWRRVYSFSTKGLDAASCLNFDLKVEDKIGVDRIMAFEIIHVLTS